MPPPPLPPFDSQRLPKDDMLLLLEYSSALMEYSEKHDKIKSFMYSGTRFALVLSIIGLFTPGMAVTSASLVCSSFSGLLFMAFSFWSSHYVKKATYVLDILESCLKTAKENEK